MKTYTYDDICDLNPCYEPNQYLPEIWRGTALDVLNVSECSALDRLWVVQHWISEYTARKFALHCARAALALIPQPLPLAASALDISEQCLNGYATPGEANAVTTPLWDFMNSGRRRDFEQLDKAAYRAVMWATFFPVASPIDSTLVYTVAHYARWAAYRAAERSGIGTMVDWQAAQIAADAEQIETMIRLIHEQNAHETNET